MKSKSLRRISPEGLIVALEQLAYIALNQQEAKTPRSSKKKHIIQTAGLEETDKGIAVTNVAGVVFALTHPWVAVHTHDTVCSNSPEMHESEYKHMLEIAEMLIDDRIARTKD